MEILNIDNRGNKHAHDDLQGINTGLTKLNELTGGWRDGQLILFASGPLMKKTELMIFFAKTAARDGFPVVICTHESHEKTTKRLILTGTNLDEGIFNRKGISASTWMDLSKETKAVSELPIQIFDLADVPGNLLKEKARNLKGQGKCSIILIDHLQVVGLKENGDQEDLRIEATLREARSICKEFNVPVILLSQVNRDAYRRTDTRPILRDLPVYQECFADIVVFLDQQEQDQIQTNDQGKSTKWHGELIVVKNREGGIGNIPFTCNDLMTEISSKSK
ncbi:MAG TPA: DnaB-like helicase C-terminal domain-containing protein [Bacteroidales bacterium]|nr:DnaB-like helicase C-terminal domain-containing protein [Bacteroidales bacterium]HPT10960.1 DnaB-like helicase C-terminal domain-containing protein [Bacteroidales bacterium]